MEQFDNERAKKVWQRVQSGMQPPEQSALQLWIRRELSEGAVYQHLYRKLQGHAQLTVQQLYRQKMQNAAILRGICILSGEKIPPIAAYPVENAPVPALLQRCYGRQVQMLTDYENKAADPRFGRIFQHMAREALESCCILLALIGN